MPVEFERGKYYTVEEAAKIGKVSASYIYRLIGMRRLTPKKTSLGLLIPYSQIYEWLETRKRPGRPKRLQGGK